MGAAARGACFRMPPFWIWHLVPFLLAPAQALALDFFFIALTSCEYLPGPTTVDQALQKRNRSFPHSGSCRTAGTALCNWHGKAASPATPAGSALSIHLPAAIPLPDNNQSRCQPG